MSWTIIFEESKENCPQLIRGKFCRILSTFSGLLMTETVECNEAECPFRVVDDDEEAHKMVAGTD